MPFNIVSGNILTMLAYMLCGFLLVTFKKGVASHAKTLSAILVYVCSPALIINAWQSIEFSTQNVTQLILFFFVSLTIQLLFFCVLFLIFRKKLIRKQPTPNENTLTLEKVNDQTQPTNLDKSAMYRILSVGSVLGNTGFFGLPLVTALFPSQPIVACFSTVYVTSMNLLVFTVGVFMITGDKKFITIKSALLNPSTIAVVFALPFFFLNIKFPTIIAEPVSLLGKMSTPLCMLVLGMRLAVVNKKTLFTRPLVYLTCLLKLVVFPLFAYFCVYFLPFVDATFKACILVLSATPSAVIVLSLAEMHDCEQELSANVVLLTTILSVVTMPLIMLIL